MSQVFQGVAKPVFQFLLNHTKSYQDSKTIRANILLNQTNDTNKNRPNDASNSQKILNQVTSNQEIILKLQSEINLKRARRSILKAYEYKIHKIQANFDQLKNNLENLKEIRNRPKSESINSQLISQLADRLLYLSTQKSKPLDIPVNAIKGILESLGLSFDASSLFAYLIRENTDAHQSIENTVNNFHPEIEMKSLGVNLKRVGEYFQVEDIDTSLIIDKLSAKVSRERDIT